jgi:hypothetical protein
VVSYQLHITDTSTGAIIDGSWQSGLSATTNLTGFLPEDNINYQVVARCVITLGIPYVYTGPYSSSVADTVAKFTVNPISFSTTPSFAWANGAANPTVTGSWSTGTCPAGTLQYNYVVTQGSATYTAPKTVTSVSAASLGSGFTYDKATLSTLSLSCKVDATRIYTSTTVTSTAYIPPITPNAPTALASSTTGIPTIVPNQLTWTAATCSPSTTEKYLVTQTAPTVVTSPYQTGTTFNLTGLAAGQAYTYTVSAECVGTNVASAAGANATLTFTAQFNIPPTPSVPTGLTGDTTGTTSAYAGNIDNLTWSAVTCQAGSNPQYNVQKVISAGTTGSYGTTGWISGNSVNIQTSWLENGATTGFDVQARCTNAAGSSPASAYGTVYSFTTVAPAPTSVPTVTGTPTASNGAFSWTAVTCAAGTTAYYQANQTERNGVTGTNILRAYAAGVVSVNIVSKRGYPYPQDVQVTAECVGPQATSTTTSNTPAAWTT